MTYKEQSKHLAGPIALLKMQCTRVENSVADDAVQVGLSVSDDPTVSLPRRSSAAELSRRQAWDAILRCSTAPINLTVSVYSINSTTQLTTPFQAYSVVLRVRRSIYTRAMLTRDRNFG